MSLIGYDGPLTSHEAVNQIMAGSLLPPIPNETQIEQSVVGSTAWRMLMAISREVQSKEWEFNRSFNRRFDLSDTNTIVIPKNFLKVYFEGGRYVVRAGKVYDRNYSTFTFTQPLTAQVIVELLSWDDLPYQAQHYIATKATRRFAQARISSEEAKKLYEVDEREALLILEQFDAKIGEPNGYYKPGHLGRFKRTRG